MSPSALDLFTEELASIHREFPGFTIKPKQGSPLCKVINAVLVVLTFGAIRSFMTDYITVIYKTMYVPPRWANMPWLHRWIALRHEGIHLRQAKNCGFGRFWLGWIIWAFAYVFLLPFGLTLRSRWEREAYTEAIRCSQRYGVKVNRSRTFYKFTGSPYFWMDLRRRKVSEWLDQLGVEG